MFAKERIPQAQRQWLWDKAREMRHAPSLAERLLWEELRPWGRLGLRFRRQYPIAPYIADLACPAARVVIELDGNSHADRLDLDATRTKDLEQAGWVVLRFGNMPTIGDAHGVAESVLHVCAVRLREFGVVVPAEASRYLSWYE